MCGRFVSPEDAAIERLYALDRRQTNPFSRRYNVAPTTLVPVIFRNRDGGAELREARWGLVPGWWKDAKLPGNTFNARSEEAATKPMWRTSLAKMRCLVPAEGWYEWKVEDRLDPATGELRAAKQPYHIRPAAQIPFAFAGLLSFWTGPQGERITSCAVMTKAAAPGVDALHERMPVVLRPEDFDAWIDPAKGESEARAIVAQAQTQFEFWPVSTLVNNARNETPALVERVPE